MNDLLLSVRRVEEVVFNDPLSSDVFNEFLKLGWIILDEFKTEEIDASEPAIPVFVVGWARDGELKIPEILKQLSGLFIEVFVN